MNIDFEITELDIYRAQKPELLLLAARYNLKVPSHPSLVTVPELRKALAITKDIFKRAQIDNEFLKVLGELFINNDLSDENAEKYPQLIEYKDLLQDVYDEPDNLSFVKDDTSSTVNTDHHTLQLNRQSENLSTAKKFKEDLKKVRDTVDNLKDRLQLDVKSSTTFTSPNKQSCSNLYSNEDIINHEKLLKTQSNDINQQSTTDFDSPDYEDIQISNTGENSKHSVIGSKDLTTTFKSNLPSVNNTYNVPEVQAHVFIKQDVSLPKMAEENRILIKPIVYSGDKYENIHEFLYRFDMAAEANFWGNETKKRLFPCHLQSYALKWYTDFLMDSPNVDFDTLKREIKKAFSSENYIEELKYTLENRVQGSDESPVQYLYTIKDLCRKINPAMTEHEIINYVTKGLQPLYFNALMYLDSANMTEFQANLKKLETKFLMQKVNAKKHNLGTPSSENFNLIQDLTQTKSVTFSEKPLDTTAQFVNVLADISQKLTDLTLKTNSMENPSFSTRRSRFRDDKMVHNSYDNVRNRNQTRSNSYDRNKFRTSPSPHRRYDRGNSQSRNFDRQYRYASKNQSPNYSRQSEFKGRTTDYGNTPTFSERQPSQINQSYGRTGQHFYAQNSYKCDLCKKTNHTIEYCFYNSKSHKFRPDLCMQFNNQTFNRTSNKFEPKRNNRYSEN